MISRRKLVSAGAATLCIPHVAQSAVQCTPYDASGIQYCEAGVYIGSVTAQQECQNWCWAACIEAVFHQHGYVVPQEAIVERIYSDLSCRPATGKMIIEALSGNWIDEYGCQFQAWGEPIIDLHHGIWSYDAAARVASELAANNPLINGAVGHATMISAISYNRNYYGQGQVVSITVRDPWPGKPNKRLLTPQEAQGTFFVGRVVVVPWPLKRRG